MALLAIWVIECEDFDDKSNRFKTSNKGIFVFEVNVDKKSISHAWQKPFALAAVSLVAILFISSTLSESAAGGKAEYTPAPGIAIAERVELSGPAAFIDSYNSTVKAYSPLQAGSNAVITVNSNAANSLSLFNHAAIKGDVFVGADANLKRSIRLSKKCEITGMQTSMQEEVIFPAISMPNVPPFSDQSIGDLVIDENRQWVINTNMHMDNLTIADNAVLIVKGTIVIVIDGNFTVGENARLEITSGSTLDLYVMGNCSISGWVNAFAGDPQGLYLFMPGEGKLFEMNDNAAVFSVLQNPAGDVIIDSETQFFGKIRANRLQSTGGIHVDLDSGFPAQQQSGESIVLEDLAGLEFVAGNVYEISWNADGGIGNVIIEYTTDNGQSWTTIDTVTNTGSYQWLAPQINSQECFIRLLEASDTSNGDVSEAFTVYVCDLSYDLNGDCKVDAEDAKLMATEWMTSGNPFK